jgi:biotin carboxyl carrier protein
MKSLCPWIRVSGCAVAVVGAVVAFTAFAGFDSWAVRKPFAAFGTVAAFGSADPAAQFGSAAAFGAAAQLGAAAQSRPVEQAPVAFSGGPSKASKPNILSLSPQARKNLGLVAKPARLQSYWRSVLIPGEVADRPGFSDRGVTAPAVGVVTRIHAFPGDSVRAGQRLFTLRLFSEYLQNTQAELFRATRETELTQEQIQRLADVAKSGAIAEAKLIELRNQLRRQQALMQACRQDLLTRGLGPDQIERVTQGEFVSTLEVAAPLPMDTANPGPAAVTRGDASGADPAAAKRGNASGAGDVALEVKELAVELGQQVQAGQLLAKLSNHQALFVIGHAFK